MPIVRLLHLSDLRGCGGAAPPDAVRVGPWGQLLDEIAEVGLVDLVCLTGDLATNGQREEYAALTPFVERACARLGVPKDRIFAVPGDLDGDRALASTTAYTRLRALARRAPAEVSAWIAGHGPTPTGADVAWCRASFERQRPFWSWLVEDLHQPERREVDALGYRATIPVPGARAQMQVFGLNSAWSAGGRGGADESLMLGREQVAAIVRDPAAQVYPGLRLALMHHPPGGLADAALCIPALAGAVDLVLCGHGPHPRFTAIVGEVRQLSGRPLGEESGVAPSCQLVQIETDAVGRPLGFAARIWTWSASDGRWLADAPDLPEAHRGRLYWPGATLGALATTRSHRLATLAGVLARLFASADELRRWLCMRLPDIYADLPGGTVSLSDLAFAAQGLLERNALIDDELFDALADFSPGHAPAVVELRRRTMQAAPEAVKTPTTSAAPAAPISVQPAAPASPAALALQEQLQRAQQRRENLRGAGLDSAGLDAEILGLRRQLREAPGTHRGEVLGDARYLLQSVLGRGGFATVWRARDRRENRDVALKILHPQDAQDPARRERFFRGARAMQQLRHPAIVRVFDPRGGERPQPFFVMEIIDGRNLHERVVHGPRMLLRDVVAITCGVGEALTVAHAQGMVHRDVKPANILLDRNGAPHLTDFDLVRARDTTGGTRSGGMGTVLYAAPELVQSADDADARADIYGLGMTVLFMLFGNELPYKDIVRNPETVLAHVDCPPAVKQVILRAIAWDREARFNDMAGFCGALRRAHEPPAPPVQQPRFTQPEPVLLRVPVVTTIVKAPRIAAKTVPAASLVSRPSFQLWMLAAIAVLLITGVIVLGSLGSGESTPPAQGPMASRLLPAEPAFTPTSALQAAVREHEQPAPTQEDAPGDPTTGATSGPGLPDTTGGEAAVERAPSPGPSASEPRGGPRSAATRIPAPVEPMPRAPEIRPAPRLAEPDEPAPSLPTAEQARPQLEAKIQARGDAQREKCRKEVFGEPESEPLEDGETVYLKVMVEAAGRIFGVTLTGSSAGSDLGACMARRLRNTLYPEFEGDDVELELEFQF